MKITLQRDVDFAEFEIVPEHNPENLRVRVDGQLADYTYNNDTRSVVISDLKQGQVVEIDQPTLTIEGEDPIVVDQYPTVTRIRFKINSLNYLPEPPDEG